MRIFFLNKRNVFIIFLLSILYCQFTVCAFLKKPLRRASETRWSGQINFDAVWRAVIIVASDVVVMPGITLTILPGTTVKFEPAKSTKIDAYYFSSLTELIIRGRQVAKGTAKQPIIFTTSAGEQKKDSWAGIYLDSQNNMENSLVENCVIENAETGIYVLRGEPLITKSNFNFCKYAIISQLQSTPIISQNKITNSEQGIFCLATSLPKIRDNYFKNIDEEAIFVARDSFPIIQDNNKFENSQHDIRRMVSP